MDVNFLKKLLCEKKEKDWFEFKSSLKLYSSDGKLVEKQRDELLKDILGMANGNSHIIRRNKYLVIGADNDKFDEHGQRVLHPVDYKVPSQSDLSKWLKNACSPSVAGIECDEFSFQGVNLFLITIPVTFDLHETMRELVTTNGTFQMHTVFMRQGEHIVPASVRDGVTIQQLKHLHRQEVTNPPSVWVGTIIGALVALIIGGAKARSSHLGLPLTENWLQAIFILLGVFFGATFGWFFRQINELRYDWRYMEWRARIAFFVVLLIYLVVMFELFFNR